ncbi:MAG: hypothetical protein R3316_00295 [Rhodovibrionaceae bacterium]|nr:hypothetical protein [Rhodovibrionaceae bacterium]
MTGRGAGRRKDGAREMALKVAGAAALLAVLAGMGSHPLPGSPGSLLRGLAFGVPAGCVVGAVAYLVLRRRETRGSG